MLPAWVKKAWKNKIGHFVDDRSVYLIDQFILFDKFLNEWWKVWIRYDERHNYSNHSHACDWLFLH